ncbi:FtsX-like permease family protein [Caldimonas sp. KR1-144]|uniref:FtsX-like permease family protein n=1 Tax=Caldimonas sp. KR1-144 TaxID=3400911 RepID=UPI003C0C402D
MAAPLSAPAAFDVPLAALLRALSWPEARRHALRHATAVLAVMLGVALAWSVHLINASALAEFGAAVRSVNGEPDLILAGSAGSLDEADYARVAALPEVALASPVIEVETQAEAADGRRFTLRVLGLDALVAPMLAPDVLPRPNDDEAQPARVALDPDVVFLNPTARAHVGAARTLALQSGLARVPLRIAGGVAAAGAPLAVMDIAGAQARFGAPGRITRVDLRLAEGVDRTAFEAAARRAGLLDGERRVLEPRASEQRLSNVSRAYRVNLTVLALVALFTGAFLVYSVLSLAVAQRQPQFALLGVLGLAARERRRLVIAEAAVVGVIGSALGLLLGTALALAALRWLGGDLGGGYFEDLAPALRASPLAAAGYGALGIVAAMVGGWAPARAAEQLPPAQALKGLGTDAGRREHPRLALGAMAAGSLLALLPPVAGLPLAAYASVAVLLLGGIAAVPSVVAALLRYARPGRNPLKLLAIERARHQRATATVAVAGVVASLALSVALTIMVASFRDAVSRWLDVVLPADLYVRTAPGSSQAAWLPPAFVAAAAALPGVEQARAQRVLPIALRPDRAPPALLARELGPDPAASLPLVGALRPARPGLSSAYVSEAFAALYDAAPGREVAVPLTAADGRTREVRFLVRGVWRDYARQHGAVIIARADYVALTGDERVNDLALTLRRGADADAVRARLVALAGDAALLEFARADELRATSLAIFDRSFAVTVWLQAVAIGIGLVGLAASTSAQVLARRREFGLMAHLGCTRRQVLAIVAGEAALWTGAGAVVGLALGLAVSVVLVYVVNPQSFHWTMELRVPLARVAALVAAVLASGTLTAWLAARRASSYDAVQAVKEDW